MDMTDKILSFLALATFVAFVGVIAWKVREIDLILVLAFGGAMAIFDFYFKPGARGKKGSK